MYEDVIDDDADDEVDDDREIRLYASDRERFQSHEESKHPAYSRQVMTAEDEQQNSSTKTGLSFREDFGTPVPRPTRQSRPPTLHWEQGHIDRGIDALWSGNVVEQAEANGHCLKMTSPRNMAPGRHVDDDLPTVEEIEVTDEEDQDEPAPRTSFIFPVTTTETAITNDESKWRHQRFSLSNRPESRNHNIRRPSHESELSITPNFSSGPPSLSPTAPNRPHAGLEANGIISRDCLRTTSALDSLGRYLPSLSRSEDKPSSTRCSWDGLSQGLSALAGVLWASREEPIRSR